MLKLTLFGPRRDLPAHQHLADLNGREICALAPIAVLCLVIGVFPRPFLEVIKPEVNAIAALYERESPAPQTAMIEPLPAHSENQ
jgi:NADH-quinone oxidoreductase subunit M